MTWSVRPHGAKRNTKDNQIGHQRHANWTPQTFKLDTKENKWETKDTNGTPKTCKFDQRHLMGHQRHPNMKPQTNKRDTMPLVAIIGTKKIAQHDEIQ